MLNDKNIDLQGFAKKFKYESPRKQDTTKRGRHMKSRYVKPFRKANTTKTKLKKIISNPTIMNPAQTELG